MKMIEPSRSLHPPSSCYSPGKRHSSSIQLGREGERERRRAREGRREMGPSWQPINTTKRREAEGEHHCGRPAGRSRYCFMLPLSTSHWRILSKTRLINGQIFNRSGGQRNESFCE